MIMEKKMETTISIRGSNLCDPGNLRGLLMATFRGSGGTQCDGAWGKV